MNEILTICKALSDGSRLRIYKMLTQKNLCVCEITDVLGLAISTVSSHLKILKQASLIEEFKDGKWVNYCQKKPSSKLEIKIADLLAEIEDTQFSQDKIAGESVDRNKICGR